MDMFLGTRAVPGKYGIPCDQFILENDGTGHFKDVSSRSPDFKVLGMVTDAEWFDYNNDGLMDLIVVGDWMPITIFKNIGGSFRKENVLSLRNTEGWWNAIESADIDHDGDFDFVLGNLGLNSKLKPSIENPVSLYVGDVDQNNSVEQIYTYHKDGKDYPVGLKQDLAKQINVLNKKFLYYKDYAGKPMNEIFDNAMLNNTKVYKVFQSTSSVLLNTGIGGFEIKPLPVQAQVAPVYSIKVIDINNDGNEDIIIGGNMFAVKTEIGRYDALHGLVLQGNGKGYFKAMPSKNSGLKILGEVRGMGLLRGRHVRYIIMAQNNDVIKSFKLLKFP
jgi:hypothetical protein